MKLRSRHHSFGCLLGSAPAVALTVTEDSANARTFSGRLRAPRNSSTAVEASYGFGYLAHRATLKP